MTSLPNADVRLHNIVLFTQGSGATNFLSEEDANLLERHRPQLMTDIKLSDGSLLAELRCRRVLTENEECFIKVILEMVMICICEKGALITNR